MLQDQDLLSIQEVRTKVEKAYAAFQHYRRFSQEQIDAIVESMAAAGRAHAREFAELAVKETGYGNVKDKIAKNLLNADLLPRAIRDMKTVGVLREVPESKIIEVGVPVGVVAAILPTTNPTSTAIYKIIISLKAGNAIVISPHPRAKECTCYTAEVLYKAALDAGAPDDIIQCIRNATIDGTNALMRHPRTGVILSTGGSGIVRAAYSSGKPAFGVGPGNVPVLIDDTADLPEAVAKVVEGKSFDYGTVCSSEQSIVALKRQRDAILEELKKNRAYLCSKEQGDALARLLITRNWTINPDCVGQPPARIAEMAGFSVPPETSILAVEIGGVGKQHPLSMEKLSPVLSLLFVQDWEEQIRSCQAILKFGGLGHTCVIYSKDDARIREFGIRMPAFRVLVNTPAPQGSTGITTGVLPSMTLGCGAMAGNITSDNIGPLHLINIKRIAYVVREASEAFTQENESAAPSRAVISEAVSRYLAQRGLRRQPSPAAPGPSTAGIVDRFLRSRATPVAPPQATCELTPAQEPPAASPAPSTAPSSAAPPSPEVRISDFVCEADVRSALHQGKKIFIGPKTIVTPAARELAGPHDILVQAQR
jgi:acetaldehyde dehydrogenase (acetylating)